VTRRRIATDDLDSLNLLLDTICNMFGIFIFTALIVAVMAMTRSTQIVAVLNPQQGQNRESAEMIAAQDSIAEMSDRLEVLQQSRSHKLAAKARQAARVRGAADEELMVRQSTLREYQEKMSRDSDFIAKLHEELPKLQDEIATLEESIGRGRQLKEVTTRTPLRRELEGRTTVQVVLDEGKVYVLNSWWNHHVDEHPCDIWCDWNTQAVDVAASTCDVVRCLRGGDVEIHRRVLLRPAGGWEAEDATKLAANQDWIRFLASLDHSKHLVSIRSTATGFQAFSAVRASIVQRGIPYNVEPIRLDPYYSDSIIQGTPIGQ